MKRSILLVVCLFVSIELANATLSTDVKRVENISKKIEVKKDVEIELVRTYFNDGTNGEIYSNGKFICYTIELPWNNNKFRSSCVPEGRYKLLKQWNKHYGWYIYVLDVPNRAGILIHKGQDAKKDLKGCIAPNMELEGHGKGKDTAIANDSLRSYIFRAMDTTSVYLKIVSKKRK